MRKMTDQEYEARGIKFWDRWQWECDPDLEYDNIRADGYRMLHEKRLAEELEQKALYPETANWGQVVEELTKRHL